MMQISISQKAKYQHYLALVVAMIFFSSANPLVRLLVQQGVDPYVLSGMRSLFTALVALPILALHGERPRVSAIKGQVFPVALLAFVGIFSIFMILGFGLQHAQASSAALIIASNPIFTVLLSIWLLKEPCNKRKIFGVAVAMVGVALCVLGDQSSEAWGLNIWSVLLVLVALLWSIYTLLNRHYGRRFNYLQLYFWIYVLSTIMFLPFMLARWSAIMDLSWSQIGWLLLLAIFPGSLAHILMIRAINAVGASAAGMFNCLTPLGAIVISALLLGERLSWLQWLGGAILISGIIVGLMRAKLPINYETGLSLSEDNAS